MCVLTFRYLDEDGGDMTCSCLSPLMQYTFFVHHVRMYHHHIYTYVISSKLNCPCSHPPHPLPPHEAESAN